MFRTASRARFSRPASIFVAALCAFLAVALGGAPRFSRADVVADRATEASIVAPRDDAGDSTLRTSSSRDEALWRLRSGAKPGGARARGLGASAGALAFAAERGASLGDGAPDGAAGPSRSFEYVISPGRARAWLMVYRN